MTLLAAQDPVGAVEHVAYDAHARRSEAPQAYLTICRHQTSSWQVTADDAGNDPHTAAHANKAALLPPARPFHLDADEPQQHDEHAGRAGALHTAQQHKLMAV